MSACVVDIQAAGELRALVSQLREGVPDLDLVIALAGDLRWQRWSIRAFDAAHTARGCCA
jgi:short-subunit dehydrogenase involved in D-alanine esterification of teichoic acids